MAHWTDGPEYAPVDRPDVFVEPDAAPLAAPDAGPARPPAEVVPPGAGRPGFGPVDAPPLAQLVAPAPQTRDPHEAFDVATTPMTAWSAEAAGPSTAPPPVDAPPPTGVPFDLPPPRTPANPSAWGAAHASNAPRSPVAWTPDQPFPGGAPPASSHLAPPPHAWPPPAVNPSGFPPPGPPPWQQAPPAPVGFAPVTIADMLRATTPGVLICLAIGALLPPLSIPLLLVASALASRIRQRRAVVSGAFSIAVAAAFGLGLASMLLVEGIFDVFVWYTSAVGWAQLANWVMLLVTPAVVGDSLRRREPPEDLP